MSAAGRKDCPLCGETIEESAGYESDLAQLRGVLGADAFDAAWAQGRTMTLDEAIRYALSDEENSNHA